jgi:hypothetical protein
MRLFIWLALAACIIALVCLAVPTQFLNVPALFWFVLAFTFFIVDLLAGGYVVAVNRPAG